MPQFPLVLMALLASADAVAGLFGPSAGEEAAMILLVIFGSVALVAICAFYFVAKVRISTRRAGTAYPSGAPRFDIFLSYSAKDADAARDLATLIRTSGLKVFFAERELEGGAPFTDEIRSALHDSREVWVLATAHSVDSVWVATEWGTAWAMQRRIVPILLGIANQRLPDRLQALHAVDISQAAAEIEKARTRAKTGAGRFGAVSRWWRYAIAALLAFVVLSWLFG